MRQCISPLENLAAFALAFCGALCALGLADHRRRTHPGPEHGGR